MKLGTYSTIDCPTGGPEVIKEAFDFLKEKFEAIDGTVRKVSNPHDFGSYPSFEIDYPFGFEDMEEEFDEECDCEDQQKPIK